MGLIRTIKHIKTINDIANKVEKIKEEKIDDLLTAIYKINVALAYLETIIVKARETLTKLVNKLNKSHPQPTPVEEAVAEGEGNK